MQKLAEICIRRPVFATMLITALLVLGMASYQKLGVDLFPKIEFPFVTVTTTLRGAAPEEIETQVTKRIEEAVNTISGIDEMRSVSAEGVSQVFITFVLEKDPEVGAQEVRDKVASVQRDLPRDIDPPVIEKVSTDASPVLDIVVSSPRDLRETTKTVDDRIKKNIESLSGVGQVRFVGDRTRQIQVWLDGNKLYGYNLNIDQVRDALARQNVEIPGGRVDQGPRELSLRTLGRVSRPRDFGKIIVSNVGTTPVHIDDIGAVEDGTEEPRSLARVDGVPAVVLEVRKQAGTNSLEVIHAVKDRIAGLRKSLPADFRITYARDQSGFIEASFHAVQEHLILGGLCAAIVVLLFIRNWRSTLIAAVAIPTSIISTYTLMYLMGFTLNGITMLALTLVVGIVIDDAIVVLENIFRFAEEKGRSPMEAAREGTRDIGLAVLATTLSLVIIFLPVALMGSIVGRFMSSFGYTAAFAILVSMLISFTLTPMLCSRFLKLEHNGEGRRSTKESILFRVLDRFYRRLLVWSMGHRWLIVSVSVLVALSSAPLFMALGKDFLPQDDQSEFEISVRMPVGSSLEGAAAVMTRVEAELHDLPGVRNLLTLIGSDSQQRVDRGVIAVEMTPVEQRAITQQQAMLLARGKLKRFRDLVIGVQLPSVIQGTGTNQDLQFFLQGPDLDRLDRYAAQIKQRLAQVPGVADLDSSYEQGKPEIRVHINRDKAAGVDVNVNSIATALRTLVGGDPQVTTYREGDDRYDVQLRVSKEFRDSPAALERLYVPSATLGNVPVANLAALEEGVGPTQIERYNRQRQIMITANLVEGQSLSNVLAIVNETIANLNMPPEYTSGLFGRSKEFGRASAAFVFAVVLSLVFMYMVLASQFESFIDPVTILLSLPLSVPFGLLSLFVFHEKFSIIYTSLGILILFGIVKKNSILQIDHIKALRREGIPRGEAILRGCEDRLRPILMTTAALVAGMLPLALGSGAGSGSRRTVAIVVIGGQSLCLLLTLLLTPVSYSLFDDLAHSPLWARLFRRRKTSLKPVLPVLVLLAFLAPAARAQHPTPQRVGVGPIQHELPLQNAIELALKSNLEIEIERSNTATAAEAVRGARGFYDPSFRWLPSLESRNTPTGSVLQGPGGKLAEHFFGQNFYLRQRLPMSGAQFGVDFENSRQSSSSPFVSLDPFVASRLVLSITQPLLRNRKIDADRATLQIRQKQQNLSEVDFEIRVIDVITRVEQSYWDLVAARQDVVVRADAVDLGRDQLERDKRQIEAGTLAPVELAASEAELQRRLDTWYAAVGTVTEAENALKTLLAGSRDADLWNEELIPVDEKVPGKAPETYNLRESVQQALAARPELRATDLRRQVNDIEKEQNADTVKPQLNLVGSYASAGLAGTLQPTPAAFSSSGFVFPPPPGTLIGGYGSTLSNLFSGRYPSLQVGLAMDFTFRNNEAEARLARSAIAERRIRLERSQVEQAIEAQVRNALQAIQTARQRIAAAEASTRAAKEKLDSEIRLFRTGESTNFLVLTRQNEYADSRRREVVANLEYNKAVARLEQALGTTLEGHKIGLK